MNSKQFAWLYLIENGLPGCTPSYYGGYDYCDTAAKKAPGKDWDYGPNGKHDNIETLYLKQIKETGVDWDKTSAPESDSFDVFNGTFAEEQGKRECLTGVLVLRNGIKQTWCADAIEVTNVFDMMVEVQDAMNRAYELFGVE